MQYNVKLSSRQKQCIINYSDLTDFCFLKIILFLDYSFVSRKFLTDPGRSLMTIQILQDI